jgi:hypothetical protein
VEIVVEIVTANHVHPPQYRYGGRAKYANGFQEAHRADIFVAWQSNRTKLQRSDI